MPAEVEVVCCRRQGGEYGGKGDGEDEVACDGGWCRRHCRCRRGSGGWFRFRFAHCAVVELSSTAMLGGVKGALATISAKISFFRARELPGLARFWARGSGADTLGDAFVHCRIRRAAAPLAVCLSATAHAQAPTCLAVSN